MSLWLLSPFLIHSPLRSLCHKHTGLLPAPETSQVTLAPLLAFSSPRSLYSLLPASLRSLFLSQAFPDHLSDMIYILSISFIICLLSPKNKLHEGRDLGLYVLLCLGKYWYIIFKDNAFLQPEYINIIITSLSYLLNFCFFISNLKDLKLYSICIFNTQLSNLEGAEYMINKHEKLILYWILDIYHPFMHIKNNSMV